MDRYGVEAKRPPFLTVLCNFLQPSLSLRPIPEGMESAARLFVCFTVKTYKKVHFPFQRPMAVYVRAPATGTDICPAWGRLKDELVQALQQNLVQQPNYILPDYIRILLIVFFQIEAILEGMARYAGQLRASAFGFGFLCHFTPFLCTVVTLIVFSSNLSSFLVPSPRQITSFSV